jgi:hypothetical protein
MVPSRHSDLTCSHTPDVLGRLTPPSGSGSRPSSDSSSGVEMWYVACHTVKFNFEENLKLLCELPNQIKCLLHSYFYVFFVLMCALDFKFILNNLNSFRICLN